MQWLTKSIDWKAINMTRKTAESTSSSATKGAENHSSSTRTNCNCFKRNNRHNETEEELECLNKTTAGNESNLNSNLEKETNEIEALNNLIIDSLSYPEDVANKKVDCKVRDQLILNDLKSKYVHGHVKVQDTSGIIYNSEGNFYLNFKFEPNTFLPLQTSALNEIEASLRLYQNLSNLPKFMNFVWNMKTPQIIIPIITGISNFKNWKNQKLEEQFRRGIVKAANKTG